MHYFQIFPGGIPRPDPGGEEFFVVSRRQEISRQDIAFLYGDGPLFVRQLLPVQIALALAAQIEEDPIIRYFYDLYFHLLPGFPDSLVQRAVRAFEPFVGKFIEPNLSRFYKAMKRCMKDRGQLK